MLFHCLKRHIRNEYGLFLAPHLQTELITFKIVLSTSAEWFLGEIPEINSRKGGINIAGIFVQIFVHMYPKWLYMHKVFTSFMLIWRICKHTIAYLHIQEIWSNNYKICVWPRGEFLLALLLVSTSFWGKLFFDRWSMLNLIKHILNQKWLY